MPDLYELYLAGTLFELTEGDLREIIRACRTALGELDGATGVVHSQDRGGHYGFIQPTGTRDYASRVYFHGREAAIPPCDIRPGLRVTYDVVEQSHRGQVRRAAVNVRLETT